MNKRPIQRQEIVKKPVPATLENPVTQERWMCEDINEIKVIDGVEFVHVHKTFSGTPGRKFLMRKDALKRVKG